MMTREQIINDLKELKRERTEDLMKLNARHDALIAIIADLNFLIEEAEKDESNDWIKIPL